MSALLRFDRGTLLLEGGEPPVALRGNFVHDPRVDAWRAHAMSYPEVIPTLRGRLKKNTAPRYHKLSLEPRLEFALYPHQKEALERWKVARGRTVIFTEDNATAYAVSTRFLIPCLTHKTKIKERQEVLERFKAGLYTAMVASQVLNEGVDVPEASVGIVLSGSSVAREFVQRLGRLLRKSEGKRAVLYEVVARATREEGVAERRRRGVRVDGLQLDLSLDTPTREGG